MAGHQQTGALLQSGQGGRTWNQIVIHHQSETFVLNEVEIRTGERSTGREIHTILAEAADLKLRIDFRFKTAVSQADFFRNLGNTMKQNIYRRLSRDPRGQSTLHRPMSPYCVMAKQLSMTGSHSSLN